LAQISSSEYVSLAYGFIERYPEAILLVGFLAFLLIQGKFHAALMLVFGITLCFANYYLFAQYAIYTFSLPYAVACACISVVLLVLIVYQLVQTA
jgi:hypothetical protein